MVEPLLNDDLLDVRTVQGEPATIRGSWAPNPAFLVGGGPSINDVDLSRLRERGVMSLGVNQVAAYAPCRAWVFSDPGQKFHHGLFFDPAIITFAPVPKLKWTVVAKRADGFCRTTVRVRECPNTYGYTRVSELTPATFFTTPHAHWGWGKRSPPEGAAKVAGGRHTILIGLRLLHWLGVKTIYLIGVDHRGRDGMCYGFAEDKRERNRRYGQERAALRSLPLESVGMQVFNCNPQSACDVFPYRSFDEAVLDCKGGVPDELFDTMGYYNKSRVNEAIGQRETWTPPHYGVQS